MPNGARRSPDAAWIFKHRIKNLDPAALSRYWPICPNFVIELKTESDRARVLRTVEIYRPGIEPETRAGRSSITGEGPVEGFQLELISVWDPLQA